MTTTLPSVLVRTPSPLGSRSGILGKYVRDIRITSCSTEGANFTDGSHVGRLSERHYFIYFDADLRRADSRWTSLADALNDLLYAPVVECWICQAPAYGTRECRSCTSESISIDKAFSRADS